MKKKGNWVGPESAQVAAVLAPAGGLWQEPPPGAAFSGRYFSCVRAAV